ncbi:E3 ubiquitin-protein ligase TRIM71-like [Sycon ciliatum]|uniref:E3 ubiquitin-protein ligase TRIM71-like n=1 Tax=Sycon ciliatum TaxID=27933 RepID=UPI0031F69A75
MASAVGGQGSVRSCVFCNVREPKDGRFLNCLHVICVSCLQENVTPEGSIECCICKELTEQRFPALALSKQLFPSHSITLAERADNEYRFAGNTGRSVELLDAGGETKTWCDFCEDANVVKQRATHACNECDGALLCDEHVEEHGKIRVFRKHEVKPLSTLSSAGEGGHSAKVSHCPLHAKQELSSACKTCCVPVCQQCLVRGHEQHDVVSLSERAKYLQEGLLKKFGGSGESTAHASHSTGSLNTCLTFNVEHMIGLAEEEMSTINDEATYASQVISDTFDTVRKLVQKGEADLLDNVDAVRWQQQRPLEKKLQRLTTMKENHSRAADLGKYLCDSRCSDADIVRLAPLVQKKLELLKTNMKAEDLSTDPRPTLQATAMPAVIEDLAAKLRSAVAVFEDTGIDLQKMTISKPERVTQREAFDVTLTVPCDQDSAMSSKVCDERMQVTLVSSMGERNPADVSSVHTRSSTDIVLRARATAEKAGDYVLEVEIL